MMDDDDARPAVAEVVAISSDLTAHFGPGEGSIFTAKANTMVVAIEAAEPDASPTLRFCEPGKLPPYPVDGWRIVFVVNRTALLTLGGAPVLDAIGESFHLASELRVIAMQLRNPATAEKTRVPYRQAKSIEFLCETVRLASAGKLVPVVGGGNLSVTDTRRIMAAKRMIDERCHEKLTLDGIARACGMNRAKLSKDFREVFDCTVAEALAARRLQQASQLLLTTDLPVSLVGYETGYLNNASFARAFGRRFGRSPSDYRAWGMAA